MSFEALKVLIQTSTIAFNSIQKLVNAARKDLTPEEWQDIQRHFTQASEAFESMLQTRRQQEKDK